MVAGRPCRPASPPHSKRRMEETEVLSSIEISTPGFNKAVHPDILLRCLIIGYTLEATAEIIGVDPKKLATWISTKPEMRVAYLDSKEADSKVAWSLYCSAIGQEPWTKESTKPSVTAQKFWLQCRLPDWNEKPPVDTNLENMPVSEVLKLAQELKEKLQEVSPIEMTAKEVAPDFQEEEDELPEGTIPFPEEEVDPGF